MSAPDPLDFVAAMIELTAELPRPHDPMLRAQVAAAAQLAHHDSCDAGDRCVYCGGCDCGAVERICAGPAGSTDSCYPARQRRWDS